MNLHNLSRAIIPQSVKTWGHITSNRYKDWQYRRSNRIVIPDQLQNDVMDYLRQDNPLLIDLRKRYESGQEVKHTVWKEWRKHVSLSSFRGEGHYVSQGAGTKLFSGSGAMLFARYLATATYTELVDDWNLLYELTEDALFGCHVFKLDNGIAVSRDLLDSILEITFLRKTLGWNRNSSISLLDIGAGYGRFTHRFLKTFPNGESTTVDAVPESTFLCDFYTQYRGVQDRSNTVPFDRIPELQTKKYDIAVNIHSWSECSRSSVADWIRILKNNKVRYLYVVPHDERFTSVEGNNKVDTFLPEITSAGYRLMQKSHKFELSQVLKSEGLQPAWYCLFELG